MIRHLPTWTAAAAAACLLLLSPAANASAEAVEATYPPFPVTVNKTALDGVHSVYPLLLHKGVTYFPMTWNYTSALGLSVSWDTEKGLSLDKVKGTCGPVPQTLLAEVQNSGAAEGAIRVPFPVTVNGKEIDALNEPYPVLLYRNITYFPMTWRFTKEEFGWQSDWEDVHGYSIQSCIGADTAKQQQAALNLSNGGQLAVDDEWIYQNPVRDSEGPHSLVRTTLDGENLMKLSDDNAVHINVAGDWLYYIADGKSGGIVKLRKNGTERTVLSDSRAAELWSDGDWLYFTKWAPNPEGQANGYASPSGIYRMKKDGTGEHQLAADGEVKNLYVYHDRIYYIKGTSGEETLYSMNPDGSDARKMHEGVTEFIIAEDWIYYVRENTDLRKISLDGSVDMAVLQQDKNPLGRLSYREGWIYFAAGSTGHHGSLPIERIRLDGTGREAIVEARPVALYWAGEEMYFAQWNLGAHVMEHLERK
ncbi:DUF5050 domain-containing protein [Paenibacillus sp. S-38]|uniref:DUF5050 domain-containing protein n=1 Tax=Paenibacillus sp. S-38 TaxID=3416710 RepID=UPI003CECD48D